MSLNTLLPIQIERPGFTNAEILRDAHKIVAYAVKRGWCSAPQPMNKIESKHNIVRQWLKENQV
jgi:hypothetical protein